MAEARRPDEGAGARPGRGHEAATGFVIAIDGPAGAGKGTIARALAARFGLAHLDTGALYRAVAVTVAVRGGDPVAAARALAPEDLLRGDLRTPEAARGAARVATIPGVRAALLDFQHRFAGRPGGAVLDGRDIGTVICPEAPVKFFVTASPEIRARRRWLEQGGEAGPHGYAETLSQVKARDARDTARAEAPLRQAADAVLLDTSALSEAEAVAMAAALVALRLEAAGRGAGGSKAGVSKAGVSGAGISGAGGAPPGRD